MTRSPGPRPCPVCSSGRKRLLFRQSFAGPDGANLLSGYDVVACEGCGLGFADRVPGQPELDLYYREASKYENAHRAGGASSEDLGRFRSIADLVEGFLPSREARLLEIGCSTGGLLALLRRDGFSRVEGLDPSPACAAAAERLSGVRVTPGSLANLPSAVGSFDMVLLVGVLEHVVDLGTAIERVRSLCAPAGRVYVEVPDALRFFDCLDAPYQQFSMEHVAYFSSRSLRNLMEGRGFETLQCSATVRSHTSTSLMPVVCGVFEASGTSHAPVRDTETATRLAAYVEGSGVREAALARAVSELVASGEAVFLWGLGTLTRRLLARGPLRRANIRAFVDSNPHYQGKVVDGVPVIGPGDLRGRPDVHAIVVASWVFQDEIERQIRDELGLEHDLIRLATGERLVFRPRPEGEKEQA